MRCFISNKAHCNEDSSFRARLKFSEVNVSVTCCIGTAVILKHDKRTLIPYRIRALISSLLSKALHVSFTENLYLQHGNRFSHYNQMKTQMNPAWCRCWKPLFFLHSVWEKKLQSEVCHGLKVWRRNRQRPVLKKTPLWNVCASLLAVMQMGFKEEKLWE